MNICILLLIILFSILFQIFCFKGTILDVSFSKANYVGILFLYVPIIFIYPATILLNMIPIEDFWVAFMVIEENIYPTSLLVLFCNFEILLVIFILFKIDKSSYSFSYPCLDIDMLSKYRFFVYYIIIFSFFTMCILWMFFDIKHALLAALLSGDSTSIFRSELRNNSVGRYFGFFAHISLPILVVIVSSPAFNGSLMRRLIILLIISFISSFGGHKAPTAELLFIYFISYAIINKIRISIKLILGLILLILIIFITSYVLTVVQYSEFSDFNSFWSFFWQRIFVAQLIGTYEQFSIFLSNPSYMFNGVPFLSFFNEVPNFNKDLLMITEDRLDPSSIGVKNTFIIAEISSIGGLFLLPFGILVYVINYFLSFRWFCSIFNKVFPDCAKFNKLIVSQFIFYIFNITGAFTDLLFFKLTIMCSVLMLPMFLFPIVFRASLFLRSFR